MVYKIQISNENITTFLHCGRPVLECQAMGFRRKMDAKKVAIPTGWVGKIVKV